MLESLIRSYLSNVSEIVFLKDLGFFTDKRFKKFLKINFQTFISLQIPKIER